MTDLIMALGSIIQRDTDTLRAISQNIANANTAGYRALNSFSAFGMSKVADGAGIASELSSLESHQSLRINAGAFNVTGRKTDIAISGDAWFVVLTPSGEMLTRDGRFRVDASGRLSTETGYPVMAQAGPLTVGAGAFALDTTGRAHDTEGRLLGQLRLQRVADATTLKPAGSGLYRASSPLLAADHYIVRQGVQERSNADLGVEMVKVMALSRHIESVQRALSAYDSMLNSGINQLGKE